MDGLDRDLAAVQRRMWLMVGGAGLVMYLLLAGFVRFASDTIRRQQSELGDQVARLRELLKQNTDLHTRVRRAARRTTELNERSLRRISAELHDGPVQDLGLALLRLDQLAPAALPAAVALPAPSGSPAAAAPPPDFQVVQSSLQHALTEIRAISAGMGLPELENRTPAETVARAVSGHEQRTGTRVDLRINGLPDRLALPLKITLYRIIQEALSNAYRHGGGAGQTVQVDYQPPRLNLLVTDRGPGFDDTRSLEGDQHLGLVGMRERVESLGGTVRVESQPGRGTRVCAQLPLDLPESEPA